MTLFTYNDAIPAANNDPSIDQPDMLLNTASIKGIIGQDHVTFGLNSGGFHKNINFDTTISHVPAPAASTGKLFIDLPLTASPILKFYGGDVANSSSQYVIGAAGSTLLFGGIIIKWFTKSITAISTVVNFIDAGVAVADFPNNAFAASVTVSSAVSGVSNNVVGYSALSKTGITISKATASAAFNVTVIVIGN